MKRDSPERVSNPYSPPGARLTDLVDSSDGVWRSGKKLVIGNTASCPERCVLCGGTPVHEQHTVTYQWVPRWIIALALLATLIFVIAYAIARKTSTLSIPLCQEHAQKRRMKRLVGGALVAGGTLGGGVFALGGLVVNEPLLLVFGVLVGFVGLLAGLILWSMATNILRVAKITKTHTWLNGAHEGFLEHLDTLVA